MDYLPSQPPLNPSIPVHVSFSPITNTDFCVANGLSRDAMVSFLEQVRLY